MAVEGPNGEGAAPAGPAPGTVFDDQVSRIALKGDLGNISSLSGGGGPTGPPAPAAPAAAPPPPDYKALGKQEAQQQFAAQVSASAGRYKIDPDALQRVIDKYQDVLDTNLRPVQVPHDIEAPAPDINSTQYTAAANQSIQAFAATHQAIREYVQSYVDTLYAIKKAYVEQDHAALDALRGSPGKD